MFPSHDTAPEKAVQAVVNSFWVDVNGNTFGVTKTYYHRPAPAITPHQHAEMMAKYAEVATIRDDPWEEFEWTYKICVDDWQRLTDHPAWNDNTDYRHIGETK